MGGGFFSGSLHDAHIFPKPSLHRENKADADKVSYGISYCINAPSTDARRSAQTWNPSL